MKLRDKLKIYKEVNMLFEKYEQEHPDSFQIEDEVGDEIMTIIGEKYGLFREEVEDIYFYVAGIFRDSHLNKLYSNLNTKVN